jgi:hypothetical protein
MIVMDEIRTYARTHYGSGMPDYLAAVDRIEVPGESSIAENEARTPALTVIVARHGVVRVYAGVYGEEGIDMSPAEALRSGWDVIAMADAVRMGWLA